MKTSKRNSNFELLRIITMLLIVFHHSIVHGLLVNSTALGQGNPKYGERFLLDKWWQCLGRLLLPFL